MQPLPSVSKLTRTGGRCLFAMPAWAAEHDPAAPFGVQMGPMGLRDGEVAGA